jgi:hypothetical protein
MGLDMYLFRKEGGQRVEVGYWRKANEIHNWFVENVQKGIDECQESPVSVAKLKALRVTVNKVLAAVGTNDFERVAETLLPTQGGFFFGGTDYDEYYIEDLRNTLDILNRAIENNEPCFYHSSW